MSLSTRTISLSGWDLPPIPPRKSPPPLYKRLLEALSQKQPPNEPPDSDRLNLREEDGYTLV